MSVQRTTSSLTLRELLERRPFRPGKGRRRRWRYCVYGYFRGPPPRSRRPKAKSGPQPPRRSSSSAGRLWPHLERPFEAVDALLPCRDPAPQGPRNGRSRSSSVGRWRASSPLAKRRDAARSRVAEATIWRIVVLLDQMLASGREDRKRLRADGRSVVCATVPGYPGVRLFIVLRVDAPGRRHLRHPMPGEFQPRPVAFAQAGMNRTSVLARLLESVPLARPCRADFRH